MTSLAAVASLPVTAPSARLDRVSAKRVALFLLKPVLLLIGFFVYLAVRVLEPWKRIRFGMLTYDRIGHLAVDTEKFLRALAADPERAKILPIMVSGPPANRQLLNMIKRRVHVTDSDVARNIYFHGILPFISGTRFHEPLTSGGQSVYAALSKAGPQLSFTTDEEAVGRGVLRQMGVPEGKPFICFHSRDKAYLDRMHGYRSREEWSYHDCRDSSIANYLPAARQLAAKGLYSVRMGSVVEEPLKEEARVIDYATRWRSDFGDIYLLARCKFFLGNTAGVVCVPPCFDIPIAAANYIPLGHAPWRPVDLFIPKTYREKGGRSLPFSRIIAMGGALFAGSAEYEAAGIEVVENDSADISALADEMDARIDGRWTPRPEDEKLQARFRALFPAGHPINGFPSRVGAEFLRRHEDLLS